MVQKPLTAEVEVPINPKSCFGVLIYGTLSFWVHSRCPSFLETPKCQVGLPSARQLDAQQSGIDMDFRYVGRFMQIRSPPRFAPPPPLEQNQTLCLQNSSSDMPPWLGLRGIQAGRVLCSKIMNRIDCVYANRIQQVTPCTCCKQQCLVSIPPPSPPHLRTHTLPFNGPLTLLAPKPNFHLAQDIAGQW